MSETPVDIDPPRTATGSGALASDWQARIGEVFDTPGMRELRDYLAARKQAGATVYPHSSHWFEAFRLTAFDRVRAVILGQDPYHGPGQAHGLSFSVPPGVPPPPSLQNIFREIDADPALEGPHLAGAGRGCLVGWARQGVLLMNSVLTVEARQAGSHRDRGWEGFTDRVIDVLDKEHEGLVFLLWGSQAQKKGRIVDSRRHRVLSAPHPSPLSAHRGFLGCRHFSRANAHLEAVGRKPIDWFDVA